MKRKLRLCALLLALLLTGCAGLPANPTPTTQPTSGPTTITLPPEPTTTALPVPPPAPATTPETTPESTTLPPATPLEVADDVFVKIRDYIPGIFTELPYATQNNFTGQVIYDFTQPWLRYGTVKKLVLVQKELANYGYALKIWDGFRPFSGQEALWNACPDPTYVSNPYTGSSSHCRGNTVDVTLVRLDGSAVEMPTGFDDFSKKADRDYSDCTEEAAQSAMLLERIMIQYGFRAYWGEWWHFTDTQDYPVDREFQPED